MANQEPITLGVYQRLGLLYAIKAIGYREFFKVFEGSRGGTYACHAWLIEVGKFLSEHNVTDKKEVIASLGGLCWNVMKEIGDPSGRNFTPGYGDKWPYLRAMAMNQDHAAQYLLKGDLAFDDVPNEITRNRVPSILRGALYRMSGRQTLPRNWDDAYQGSVSPPHLDQNRTVFEDVTDWLDPQYGSHRLNPAFELHWTLQSILNDDKMTPEVEVVAPPEPITIETRMEIAEEEINLLQDQVAALMQLVSG